MCFLLFSRRSVLFGCGDGSLNPGERTAVLSLKGTFLRISWLVAVAASMSPRRDDLHAGLGELRVDDVEKRRDPGRRRTTDHVGEGPCGEDANERPRLLRIAAHQ